MLVVAAVVGLVAALLSSAGSSQAQEGGGELGAPVVGVSSLVNAGDVPAVTYLQATWLSGTASEETGTCTGTLVDDSWVLTTAHCVMLDDGTPADAVELVIGSVDIVGDVFVGPPAAGVEIWESDGWVIHGDASIGPARWFNDVAMVHIPGASAIEPMALASRASLVEPPNLNSTLPATFYGFGLSECVPGNCETADGLLRLGNSRIYHDDFIADGFPFLNNKELDRNVFMLPNLTVNGGGCFGDSGGPVTVVEDGQIRVAGVSSFISSETNNFCDGFAIEPGTVFLLHAVTDLVGTDLNSWVTSIKDASGTCAGSPTAISGSNQGDVLVGTAAANVMDGRGGSDAIIGREGNDVLCGGGGGDDIQGGNGRDTIRGGKGRDVIAGGRGADTISGGSKGDTISGGSGGDTIDGNGGPDTIEGKKGRDAISGNGGADFLRGNGGADNINGGRGLDDCEGGRGVDQLRSCNEAPRQPNPTPTPAPRPRNPGDSRNCSDFSTYSQAKTWFDTYFRFYGDIARLDQDNDRIPCESLPGAPR